MTRCYHLRKWCIGLAVYKGSDLFLAAAAVQCKSSHETTTTTTSRPTSEKRTMAEAKHNGGMAFQFKRPYFNLTEEDFTKTLTETDIVGKIPTWLNGSLYRNGPGIYKVGEDRFKHLFDGFAVLHRFDLHGGKVKYMSRVLDTDSYERSIKANRLMTTEFATFHSPDPCKSLLGKFMSFFKPQHSEAPTDNVSVNIVEHGDRLYAMTETPWLVQVDPEALKVAKKDSLTKTIAVHMSTAHPHFDAEGNMYNLGTAFNPPNNYNIVRIPPAKSPEESVNGAELLASLESRWKFTMSYNHSFGMSRDYFVIMEQPITMSSLKFLTNNWRKAAAFDNFNVHPNEELIFRLVRRSDNREVNIKFRAEPAFTFHFANCFEEQGQLVVDFVGFSDLNVLSDLYLHNLDNIWEIKAKPTFRRYVLPLNLEQANEGVNLVILPHTTATAVLRSDGTVFLTPDYVIEGGVVFEFPMINYEKVNTKKYRYVYGTGLFTRVSRLVKLDLEERKILEWKEEGYQPGEPVFVQTPGTTREDDGVILSPVVSLQGDQRCFLLVLDAATFQELGRALTTPQCKMNLTFHGSYVHPKQGSKE